MRFGCVPASGSGWPPRGFARGGGRKTQAPRQKPMFDGYSKDRAIRAFPPSFPSAQTLPCLGSRLRVPWRKFAPRGCARVAPFPSGRSRLLVAGVSLPRDPWSNQLRATFPSGVQARGVIAPRSCATHPRCLEVSNSGVGRASRGHPRSAAEADRVPCSGVAGGEDGEGDPGGDWTTPGRAGGARQARGGQAVRARAVAGARSVMVSGMASVQRISSKRPSWCSTRAVQLSTQSPQLA